MQLQRPDRSSEKDIASAVHHRALSAISEDETILSSSYEGKGSGDWRRTGQPDVCLYAEQKRLPGRYGGEAFGFGGRSQMDPSISASERHIG